MKTFFNSVNLGTSSIGSIVYTQSNQGDSVQNLVDKSRVMNENGSFMLNENLSFILISNI